MNLYKLLEVNHNTNTKQIKKAYHRLDIKNDPNKKKENAGKFSDVILAYSILNNKSTKFVYDLIGPNSVKMLRVETTRKILCSIINPINVFFFLSITVSYSHYFYIHCVFLLSNESQKHSFFMSNVLINYTFYLLVIDLIIIRMIMNMKREFTSSS